MHQKVRLFFIGSFLIKGNYYHDVKNIYILIFHLLNCSITIDHLVEIVMEIIEVREESMELLHLIQAEEEMLQLLCILLELLEGDTEKAGAIIIDLENLMGPKLLEQHLRVHIMEEPGGAAMHIGQIETMKDVRVTEVVE